jgi:hypothetical protein
MLLRIAGTLIARREGFRHIRHLRGFHKQEIAHSRMRQGHHLALVFKDKAKPLTGLQTPNPSSSNSSSPFRISSKVAANVEARAERLSSGRSCSFMSGRKFCSTLQSGDAPRLWTVRAMEGPTRPQPLPSSELGKPPGSTDPSKSHRHHRWRHQGNIRR